MGNYANIVGRADIEDALMPDQVVAGIIKDAAAQSIMLRRAKQVRMTSKKAKQAVLSTLPDAYWVDGDDGLKQTSDATWKNLTITAEELAVIVPIPDAVLNDANVPLWDQVKPLIAEAIGKKVDQAALFGVDKPDSWPTAIVPAATAAGNIQAVSDKLAVDIAALAEKVSVGGFAVDGFASRPGLSWKVRGLTDTAGRPIFADALNGNGDFSVYGYPLDEVRNGAWNAQSAELAMLDWSKFIIGIRQDVTYDIFKEGVISDENGKVILNLMQQDTQALRAVFRVGFQVAIPTNRLTGESAYPAGILTPAVAADPEVGA